MIARSVVAGSLLAAWAAAAPAQDAPQRAVEVLPIRDGFHLVRTIGNLTVLAGSDGIFLADSGDLANAPQVLDVLRGISDKPVRFIVNSHWHSDHVGGNEILGASAVRIAHRRTSELLGSERIQFGERVSPLPPSALPNVTYESGMTIEFGGERIRIFHAPESHTAGDSMVYFETSRVLHTGDIFFLDRFPFVDLQSGGTVEGYTATVGRLLEWLPADVVIVPGHGRAATVEDLRAYHAMLTDTGALVRSRIREGQTLERILQAGLGEQWRTWEWKNGFITADRWIRLIYQSHTGAIESIFEPETP